MANEQLLARELGIGGLGLTLQPKRFIHGYGAQPSTLQALACTQRLAGHQAGIITVEWSANGELLASSGDDSKIGIWDPHRGRNLNLLDVVRCALSQRLVFCQ